MSSESSSSELSLDKTKYYKPFKGGKEWSFNFQQYVLIILNRPIFLHPSVMENLWNGAILRVLVDGGANHWLEFIQKYCPSLSNALPDLLCGDFDSILQGTFEYFESRNVKILDTPDQNFTDFQKAIMEVSKYKNLECKELVAVCHCGGRLDQLFSTVGSLSFVNKYFGSDCTGYLLNEINLTWLLPSGKHVIELPPWVTHYPCGLLPFASVPTSVSTTGLKWNLDNHRVAFDETVSASNRVMGSEVTIVTNACIIWTVGLDEETSCNCMIDCSRL